MRKTGPNYADTSKFPYLVSKPYADVKYCKTWKEARQRLANDVNGFMFSMEHLRDSETSLCCINLLETIDGLPENETGVVDGIIEPVSGMRYRAEIRRR